MDFTKFTAESLDRYFNSLFHAEILGERISKNMLVLVFLEELLSSQLSYFVTEEDYNDIIKALYCLVGTSCHIPLPKFEAYDSIMHDIKTELIPRVTEIPIEGKELRCTEGDNIRIKA